MVFVCRTRGKREQMVGTKSRTVGCNKIIIINPQAIRRSLTILAMPIASAIPIA